MMYDIISADSYDVQYYFVKIIFLWRIQAGIYWQINFLGVRYVDLNAIRGVWISCSHLSILELYRA